MMGFLKTLRELCFPPRCVGCGQRLEPTLKNGQAPYFCKQCGERWQKRLMAQCPQCNAAFCECNCQPAILKKAGSAGLVKAAPYDTERPDDPMVYAVRSLKQHPRARALECLAKELLPILEKRLAELNEKTPISHTVIAYIPRARHKIRRYGFDQARELAGEISRLSGLPLMPLLKRSREAKEQKGLTQKERQENLKGAFSLTTPATGSRVVLVDDVVTTGAGMAEATRLLRRGGAKQVLCLCAALTPKRRGNRRST